MAIIEARSQPNYLEKLSGMNGSYWHEIEHIFACAQKNVTRFYVSNQVRIARDFSFTPLAR